MPLCVHLFTLHPLKLSTSHQNFRLSPDVLDFSLQFWPLAQKIKKKLLAAWTNDTLTGYADEKSVAKTIEKQKKIWHISCQIRTFKKTTKLWLRLARKELEFE